MILQSPYVQRCPRETTQFSTPCRWSQSLFGAVIIRTPAGDFPCFLGTMGPIKNMKKRSTAAQPTWYQHHGVSKLLLFPLPIFLSLSAVLEVQLQKETAETSDYSSEITSECIFSWDHRMIGRNGRCSTTMSDCQTEGFPSMTAFLRTRLLACIPILVGGIDPFRLVLFSFADQNWGVSSCPSVLQMFARYWFPVCGWWFSASNQLPFLHVMSQNWVPKKKH